VKVWIDLSNSPHPLLFAPVARELERRGHEVAITVRDHAQTLELARERWPTAEIVLGRRFSSSRAATAGELATRAAALRRWARSARPDVALSHNSYAQIVAGWSLRIPTVTAMDYEHQPMNHLAFRLARRILLPAAIPAESVARQGARPRKVHRYEGLKEEVYLGDFAPDARVLDRLGIPRAPVLVVARSGATRSAYHGYEDRMLMDSISRLGRRADVVVVVVARHPEHRQALAALDAPNLVVPGGAVDARSLLREADAFLGAGGTMTREAALLGTPAFSVFAGVQPAVDRALQERGLLWVVQSPADLDAVEPRRAPPTPLEKLRERSDALVDIFASETLSLCEL
jgi:predicted glycosyltransferase